MARPPVARAVFACTRLQPALVSAHRVHIEPVRVEQDAPRTRLFGFSSCDNDLSGRPGQRVRGRCTARPCSQRRELLRAVFGDVRISKEGVASFTLAQASA